MIKSFQNKPKGFVCRSCGAYVSDEATGTHNRNHCPVCLYSRHVDIIRGDRHSQCRGMMKPIGIVKRKDGEELIVHQCQGCSFVSKNRLAGDDSEDIVQALRAKNVGAALV